MTDAELQERIESFPRWHYQMNLRGRLTPIADLSRVNRHEQRREYFFRPVVDLLGGTLRGKRVLDLGCNAGYWSLCAILDGCEYVLGIDGRPMHIEQANLVFEVKGVDPQRYDFRCANLFDVMDDAPGRFDIVLCLGLLYHVSKPMSLLEWIAGLNTDLLVIDTMLSSLPGSAFEVFHEPIDDPRAACDRELVLVPTRTAVLDMVRVLGYQAAVLEPSFSDYTGAEDFQAGTRRAIICSKRTPLGGLPVCRLRLASASSRDYSTTR
jgi:SAM-dependent methyltransferase